MEVEEFKVEEGKLEFEILLYLVYIMLSCFKPLKAEICVMNEN